MLLAGALGAGLMLVSLGRRPLWFDETVSVEAARLPAGALAHYLFATESNMALYHLVLRVWLLPGGGEAWARGLSVAFALATLPVVYALAVRLFDRRTAAVAVILLAGNVAFVGHAREARGYSLALLLVTASTLQLVRAVTEGGARRWALYAGLAALSVFAHLFAALCVLAQLVSLVAVRRRLDRSAVLAAAAAGLLAAPVLATAALHGQGAQIDWLEPPRLRQLPGLLAWYTDSVALDLLLLAGGALAVVRARADWRAHRSRERLWPYALLVAWLALPALVAFGISTVKPVYLYRYFLFSLPALVLAAAAGLARLRTAWLAAALAVAVALSVRTTAACLPDCKVRHDDWRGAAAFVDARSRPGDAIVFDPGELRTAFAHYAVAGRRLRLLYPERRPLAGGTPEGASTLSEAVARAARYERVWLVTWWLPQGTVPSGLSARLRLRLERAFAGDVRVRLYERRSST